MNFNQMIARCIRKNHITSSCHVHASYCCICLCFDCRHHSFSIAGVCPLSVDVVPTMSSMTPMKSYTIFRSARQAKNPLFIPIQSHSLAPRSLMNNTLSRRVLLWCHVVLHILSILCVWLKCLVCVGSDNLVVYPWQPLLWGNVV